MRACRCRPPPWRRAWRPPPHRWLALWVLTLLFVSGGVTATASAEGRKDSLAEEKTDIGGPLADLQLAPDADLDAARLNDVQGIHFPSRLFQRFDLNQDGQLNELEVGALLKALSKSKSRSGGGSTVRADGTHDVAVDGEVISIGESDFELLFKQLSNMKNPKDPSKDPRMSLQEDIIFVQDVVLVLFAATVGGTVASLLKQPPLMGYIIGGMIIGPGCLGMITELVEMETLASLGIAFLLFSLGIEFSLTELQKAKRLAIFGGLTSMFGACVLVGLIARVVGLVRSIPEAIALGLAVSLSSTAVVLQCLPSSSELAREASANGEAGAAAGEALEPMTLDSPKPKKVALTLLVIQDIMIGLILALLPTLRGSASDFTTELISACLRLSIFVLLALITAEYVMPFVLDRLDKAQSVEIFTIGVVVCCLVVSYISERLGLAIELGAFVAGIMLSESRHRERVEHSINTIRDLFVAIFFVAIGMMIQFRYFYSNLLRTLLLLVVIVAVKGCVMAVTAYVFGELPVRTAFAVGMAISQAGEFTFVVASKGQGLQLFSATSTRMILGATALSMLLTPLMIDLFLRRSRRAKVLGDHKLAPRA